MGGLEVGRWIGGWAGGRWVGERWARGREVRLG